LLFLVKQADLVECGTNLASRFTMADTGNDKRERNVIEDWPVIEKLVVLEHHSDLSSICRNLSSRNASSVLPVNDDLPAGRTIYQRDESQ